MDSPEPAPMDVAQKQKKGGAAGIIGCVVFLVLLIGVSVFAFMSFSSASDKQSEIDTLTKQVEDKDKKIKEISEAVGVEVKDGEEVSAETIKESLGNTIALKDIGYKLTIPDNYIYVSFFYTSSAHPSLQLWGVGNDRNYQQFPAGDPEVNPSGMGAVTFLKTGEKFDCIASCPEKITGVIEGYDVYYESPQAAISLDKESQKLEVEDVARIKKILTSKENYSKL